MSDKLKLNDGKSEEKTSNHEATDNTISLSASSETEFFSTSAPVNIPYAENKNENNTPDMQSHNNSPSQPPNNFDLPLASFTMTQSLKDSQPEQLMNGIQRTLSSSPLPNKNEHEDSQKSPSLEDPFFPFLEPDVGSDMSSQKITFPSTLPTDEKLLQNLAKQASATKKFRWNINKNLSEANIGPRNGTKTATATCINVPQKKGAKPLKRKTSITSNFSYVFGSSFFNSPTKSQTSMTSDRFKIIADSPGIYPSLASLVSADLGNFYEDELVVPLSHPRSVSAYNSRQNSRIDLQEDKKKYIRSNSGVSRGSSSSLSTRIFRDNDAKSNSVKEDDEEADKLTDAKPIINRTQPKKQWQQTMPDLVEGPESDTLTIQSTLRNNLAAAALALSIKEHQEKMATNIVKVEESEVEKKKISVLIYQKNLYVICFVFFFAFGSYLSLRNLQSSLNDKGGLGQLSLSCLYASLFLGSIFTPTIVCKLKPKFSMLLSLLGFFIYNLANFYPHHLTLIPGALIMGTSLATIWTSQATYLANNAIAHSKLIGSQFQNVLSKYHGTFFGFFQLSQVIGGFISSLIFSLSSPSSLVSPTNFSLFNVSKMDFYKNHSFVKREIRAEESSSDFKFFQETTTFYFYSSHSKSNKTTFFFQPTTTSNYISHNKNNTFFDDDDLDLILNSDLQSLEKDAHMTKIHNHSFEFNFNLFLVNISNNQNNKTNESQFFTKGSQSQGNKLTASNTSNKCGMLNCPLTAKAKPEIVMAPIYYYTMIGIFLSSTVMAILVLLFFLDPLEGEIKTNKASIIIQLCSVFRFIFNPNVIIIIPLMSYTLLQSTFIFGEFNVAYVTCHLGIHMIGYLTVVLSFCSGVSSFLAGLVQKFISQEIIILTGLNLHLALLITLWFWKDTAEQTLIFFIIVGAWGIGDGLIIAQVISLLGTTFTSQKEAAFSTYKMMQSSTACIMFIIGPYICTKFKVIIVIVMCILSIIGYIYLKFILRRRNYLLKKEKHLSVSNVYLSAADEKAEKA